MFGPYLRTVPILIPIPWHQISLTQSTDHPLVFFSSKKNVHLAFAFVDFVSVCRLLLCQYELNALKIIKYIIITVVLPQQMSLFPWNYREFGPHPVLCYREVCPHYSRVTTVTAGLPWSLSPCSSLHGIFRQCWLYANLYTSWCGWLSSA